MRYVANNMMLELSKKQVHIHKVAVFIGKIMLHRWIVNCTQIGTPMRDPRIGFLTHLDREWDVSLINTDKQ